MQLFRRVFVLVILLALGCSAQSPNSVDRSIEHQVRSGLPSNIAPMVKIEVGPRKPSSDFPNYDALSVTLSLDDRKQVADYLVSKDGKTLLRMTKMDLSSDPYSEVMEKINLQGRPVRGNKDAKVTIVSYDDFQCPYCARMHQTLFNEVMSSYNDRVRVIYKDLPLPMHNWAIHAASDANCLAAQSNDAYWSMADYVHANQMLINTGGKADPAGQAKKATPEEQMGTLDKITADFGQKNNVDMPKLQACMKAQSDQSIQASMKEARALGVEATPTLFINGEKIDGALPPEYLRAVINRALREAGQPVPPPPAPSATKPAAPVR